MTKGNKIHSKHLPKRLITLNDIELCYEYPSSLTSHIQMFSNAINRGFEHLKLLKPVLGGVDMISPFITVN